MNGHHSLTYNVGDHRAYKLRYYVSSLGLWLQSCHIVSNQEKDSACHVLQVLSHHSNLLILKTTVFTKNFTYTFQLTQLYQ